MADQPPGIRLSKDERKQLLADLERDASRREPPERLLQRALAAAQAGQLDVARRLTDQLDQSAPNLAGLDYLREQLHAAERQHKHAERLRQAEDMVIRAVQQRKKPLAQMALQTLEEIAPQHPRLDELRIWVRDLDREVALHSRIDELLAAGRVALQGGDLGGARRQLDALQKLDPMGLPAETFSAELEAAEQGQAASAGIGRLKQEIDDALTAGDTPRAHQALAELQATDVPRVTIQTYARRIEETSQRLRDASEAQGLIDRFDQHLGARQWQAAREVAQHFGQRFPDDPRSTQMFNRVAELEAADRRRQSIQQGLASCEQFIAQGKKLEAQLALKLLRSMNLDAERIAQLEARIAQL
ncbi:MAG: hypothetical protein AAGM22_01075 [Acidobacteriota bacterium]